MIAPLVLALSLNFAQAAADGDAFAYHLGTHLEAVRAERTSSLSRAYEQAAEDRRAAAAEILVAGRDPRRPALRPLPLEVLARAGRALADSEGSLAALADSLDLRVAPGCFEAREEGLGEAMVVHVSQLWSEPGVDALLGLWWERGGARQLARSEPIPAAAFARGFEMYVRPPASKQGRWRLVPELEVGGSSVRGAGVPVDAVEGLSALRASLRGTSPLGAGAAGRAFAERLRLLERFGARGASLVSLDEQVRLLSGALDVRTRDLGSDAGIAHELLGEGPRRGALVLLEPTPASALEVLAPERRARWRALAASRGCRLIVVAPAAATPVAGTGLALAEAACEEFELERMTLVARGEAALLLPEALRRAGSGCVRGLVLYQSPAAARPESRPAPCPTTFIQGGVAESVTELLPGDGPPRTWARVPWPDELLGDFLARWIPEEPGGE